MRKLFLNLLVVLFVSVVSLYTIQFTAFQNLWFKKMLNYFGTELYVSVQRAQQFYENKIKLLVLGDSSGKQQFGENISPGTVSLSCNQATTMVGQYILLELFFKNNTNQSGGKACLIYHPASFRNNMDQKYTYHYLLKPFYKTGYKQYFNHTADSIIQLIPRSELCQFPLIKMTKWSPQYGIGNEDEGELRLSKISIEYLKKLDELCHKNDYSFKVVPPLMNEKFENDTIFNQLKYQIKNNGLSDIFSDYFDDMRFLPDSLFMDPVHLKSQYVKRTLLNTDYQNRLITKEII